VEGIGHGDVYRHLLPRHAFEHFAKERCLLPAEAFPWYRDRMAETPWWRLSERLKRVDKRVLAAVLEEIRQRGPLSSGDLSDHGRVKPLDWSGWKGTARATSMALEVLWTRCEIVVAGRHRRGKLYDVPERALPPYSRPPGEFGRWALTERVEAAGLLGRVGGPVWSMLKETRLSPLPDQLVEEGVLREVKVEGASRRYLVPVDFRERRFPADDGRMRILGPLDPLLWDRALVKQAFDFEYVWEVYKPKKLRRWGWYVCPLLHRGELVGRIEARVDRTGKKASLVVDRLWRERGKPFDRKAFKLALECHAEALGAEKLTFPRRG
jgi:uncharacterized protein YcaQ